MKPDPLSSAPAAPFDFSANPPVVLPDYAELFCLSSFSFLKGASMPEELVERAAELGYTAIAITDECSLAGVVRAQVRIRELKKLQPLQPAPHLVIGSWFRLDEEEQTGPDRLPTPAFDLVFLAQNREGYGNLSELITLARTRENTGKGEYRLTRHDLSSPGAEYAHLASLPDCFAIWVVQPHAGNDMVDGMSGSSFESRLIWLKQTFGDRAALGMNLLMQPSDALHKQHLQAVSIEHGIRLVAVGNVQMHVRSRKPLHDTLCAIRLNQTIAECGYQLAANAEQHLRSRVRLASLYPADVLNQTVHLADHCHFSLDQLRYEYPQEVVPAGHTTSSYLHEQTWLGARRHYPDGVPEKITMQVEKELNMISEMGYESYFLTVYDIVQYARSQHILCQGRGSAANSAVCFCLGITAVDPDRSNLLFERFISRERNEPPDIDVDFEHQRREEIIQYIYRRYGRRRAALTAVVICYRNKSVLRDVGRALGIDASIVDQVTRSHRWWDNRNAWQDRLLECGLDPDLPLLQQWGTLAMTLRDFPRHLSQHPGGFVISGGPLSRLVPIENASMPNRSVIQWDKDDLDDIGLLKVDILALGMLSMLRRALALMALRQGVERVDLSQLPAEDRATYDMICRADTVGVFQIESRAQMSMLPRLRPRQFYDLVVEIAIVRPGPIQGNMVHPYLQRKQNGVKPGDCPAGLEDALQRTLGVPILQEQVMQIAMIGAGFSAEEADGLRRSMAAWKRRGGIEKYRDRLVSGMISNHHSAAFAEQIYRQMCGFGEYGFPESHAASFALLTYASSWIKCHEPAVFLTALLNSQPMGFYSPSQLIQDARRHGISVLPVDVQHSRWEAMLEQPRLKESAVRLGMNQVKGLSEDAAHRIAKAARLGAFSDMSDLAHRAHLDQAALHALASANACATLAGNRHEALWQARNAAPLKSLLAMAPVKETALSLAPPTAYQDTLGDYHALGMTLGQHPVSFLREPLSRQRFICAERLISDCIDGQFVRGCGLVTGRQRPGTANGTMFLTIEDETGSTNVII